VVYLQEDLSDIESESECPIVGSNHNRDTETEGETEGGAGSDRGLVTLDINIFMSIIGVECKWSTTEPT
jgi:hypothetical protein